MVELAVNTEDAFALTELGRRPPRPVYEVVNFLATAGRTPAAEVSYYTGASSRTLKTMEKAGLIAFSDEEELRVPSFEDVEPGPEILLNEEQETAFEEILGRVREERPSVTLLRGVTGSGKTQVYLRLVQETLALGKTAMVLVPRRDAPNDAEIQLLLRQKSRHVYSSPENDGALRPVEAHPPGRGQRGAGDQPAHFCPPENLGLIDGRGGREAINRGKCAPVRCPR